MMKLLRRCGGSGAIFVKAKLLDFYGWEIGKIINVDVNSERILITRVQGTTVSRVDVEKLIKINRKDLL